MPRLLMIGGWSAAGFLALLAAWSVPAGYSVRSTCLVCRLGRVEARFFGFSLSSYQPTECSRWYAEHVEPSHDHIWERYPCSVMRNLLGAPVGFACGPGPFPIHSLDLETQMGAYQHFKDPLEAKRLFLSLAGAETLGRIDQELDFRNRLKVSALMVWEGRGFPGTWEEWWAEFYARELDERKESAAWRDSGSGLSFDE